MQLNIINLTNPGLSTA